MLPRDGHLCCSEDSHSHNSAHQPGFAFLGRPCAPRDVDQEQSQRPGPSPGWHPVPALCSAPGGRVLQGCWPEPSAMASSILRLLQVFTHRRNRCTLENLESFCIYVLICLMLPCTMVCVNANGQVSSWSSPPRSSGLRIPTLTSLELTVSTQHTISTQSAHS